MTKDTSHEASASALGFYFQSFFAFKALVALAGDEGAVAIETADDVELQDNGQVLLFQLKHTMKAAPSALTLSSRGLWRAVKAWIDVLPRLSLSETVFHLVTVAPIASGNLLEVLRSPETDRSALLKAMVKEAERVVAERKEAQLAKKPLPHGDRAAGCVAFLGLTPQGRLNLLRQVRCEDASSSIDKLEGEIAGLLTLIKPDDRALVARRLIEWWDRQVVYALCGKRAKFISRMEFQEQITEFIADIEQDRLTADFEMLAQPADYQPDGMLTRQIKLVDGKGHDLAKAIREEWKARQQRSKWVNERPTMAARIADYDHVLKEHWSDRHVEMADACEGLEEAERRSSGLGLLRWVHNEAPSIIRPIEPGFAAPYYVRGSYQVLAIDREVGWHPDYVTLLMEDKS